MTPDYNQLPRPERAQYITDAVSKWAKKYATRFAVLGLMLYEFESEHLWEEVIDETVGFPFGTFGQWMARCTPGEKGEAYPPARSTAYAALKARKALLDIPAADYAQIREANVGTLVQLSTAVRRDPAVLEAARGANPALVALVKEKHADQHVEASTMFRCPLSEGQMDDVEKAIAMAMNRGCASKSEVLWMWAVAELSQEEIPRLEEVECEGTIQ
jgi:hypothetical protein